jgi:hypothetical protein
MKEYSWFVMDSDFDVCENCFQSDYTSTFPPEREHRHHISHPMHQVWNSLFTLNWIQLGQFLLFFSLINQKSNQLDILSLLVMCLSIHYPGNSSHVSWCERYCRFPNYSYCSRSSIPSSLFSYTNSVFHIFKNYILLILNN